jgi:SAM-dependent methyltransferase
MFFPDMALAVKEMGRVLKPGGRVATSVWNVPDKNFWVTCIMGSINKNLQPPPPPAGAPGMFRCAGEGFMKDLFVQAGLKNISEREIAGKLDCTNAEGYWNFMNEVAGPVAAALGKVDDDMKMIIKSEVLKSVQEKYPTGKMMVDSNAIVIYGEK